jgi:membrane protein implicated in regulation of membrane protease activity
VVGCFILLLNARLILGALEAPPAAWWTAYAVLFTVSAIAITYVVRLVRRDEGTPSPETSEQGPESVHA